jgi:hypothetical protein
MASIARVKGPKPTLLLWPRFRLACCLTWRWHNVTQWPWIYGSLPPTGSLGFCLDALLRDDSRGRLVQCRWCLTHLPLQIAVFIFVLVTNARVYIKSFSLFAPLLCITVLCFLFPFLLNYGLCSKPRNVFSNWCVVHRSINMQVKALFGIDFFFSSSFT